MESLQTLALKAVPNPGKAAELFLPEWHPSFKALQERDYAEMRARFQKEHKEKFRSVLISIRHLPSCPITWSYIYDPRAHCMCPHCHRMFHEEHSIHLRLWLRKNADRLVSNLLSF